MKDSYLTFLGREHINFHSEAGFMIFNTKNKFHKIFWDKNDGNVRSRRDCLIKMNGMILIYLM